MKTVGIIGAGAAGLCALKRSLNIPGWSVIAWEQAPTIGGTWVYEPQTGKDKHGNPIHSSMYENLKTNLPKEIMGFLDYPFPEDSDSFIHHSKVLSYLESYAKNWKLHQHIKFEHSVEKVQLVKNKMEAPRWSVSVKNLRTQGIQQSEFDFIFVCNGHYADPSLPEIEHFCDFQGESLHSHSYRSPKDFKKRRVAVLGAGPSGVDIALELCDVADKVFLCHDLPERLSCALPENMTQEKGIKSAFKNGFVLKDDSRIEADVLLHCTGYNYNFPFLDGSCGITVEENCVKPLYKHVLHADHPTMGFPGLVIQVLPFPLLDIQIQYLIAVFLGNIDIPTASVMKKETLTEMSQRRETGMFTRHFHKLGNLQWDYLNDLVAVGGLEPLPSYIRSVYDAIRIKRKTEVCLYKRYRIVVENSNSFRIE